MTDHEPVRPHLRLDLCFRHVESIVQEFDPDLRLRKSVDRPTFYVLERKCRRRPAVNAGLGDHSDLHVQARDGYIHISLVHWQWLTRPANIITALQEEGEDLFAKSGNDVADELEYEERWAKESKRRRRKGLLRDIAVDAYDPLSRMGNKDGTERTRINSPGWPAPLEASDTASTSTHQGGPRVPDLGADEHAGQPLGAS